jgi:hypothetical protein
MFGRILPELVKTLAAAAPATSPRASIKKDFPIAPILRDFLLRLGADLFFLRAIFFVFFLFSGKQSQDFYIS